MTTTDRVRRRRQDKSLSTQRFGISPAVVSIAPVLLILIALIATSVVLAPGFLSLQGINATVSAIVPVGIVAVGMTFVIVAGGIDVSVGATFAVGGVTAVFISNASGSPILAAVGAVVVGALVGLLNGLIIALLRLNPFIVTLGTTAAIAGCMKIATDNTALYSQESALSNLARSALLGLVTPFWILLACVVLAVLALGGTTYGRSIFAVGDSLEASRIMGRGTLALRVSTYVTVGAGAALGGFVYSAQTGVGLVTVSDQVALLSIAAVVVGGTTLAGGRGGIARTVIGVAIFAVIDSLFRSLALTGALQNVVLGTVILVALVIDRRFSAAA